MDPIKTIGKILNGETRRDAVHVAIAPVVAAEPLRPGDHVGIDKNGNASATEKHIGVVDPFIKKKTVVHMGEQFWLMLYPGSITSLCHEWTHPDFVPPEPRNVSKERSKIWMEEFASEQGLSCDEILAIADHRGYHDEGISVTNEFWRHFEILTGHKGDGRDYFSCAC